MRANGTITRRMHSAFSGLEGEFKALYDRRIFETRLEDLKRVGSTSARPSKLQKLYDLFEDCGISFEKNRETEYYEELIKKADIPFVQDLEERMIYAVYRKYEQYPAPEDYMKRMVDRLSEEEDHWEDDTLRLRILKQFIKYGNYLKDAGYGGKKAVQDYVKDKIAAAEGKDKAKIKVTDEDVLKLLDDGVFDCLLTATKDQKKHTLALLKIADDLGSAKFLTQCATKKQLYLFAMVYGMTYFTGSEAELQDPKTDIEINLFRDYYTNNLIRFLRFCSESDEQGDHERNKQGDYERDPSGQGINYKNFAEIVCLYYIVQDCSPQEKIRRSYEMIKRVQQSTAEKKFPEPMKDESETIYYKRYARIGDDEAFEDILHLPEADFEEFICTHYQTEKGTLSSVWQVKSEQKSAYKTYEMILNDLLDLDEGLRKRSFEILRRPEESSPEDRLSDELLDTFPVGLWFIDVKSDEEELFHTLCEKHTDVDRKKFKELMTLLKNMNDFLKERVIEDLKALCDPEEPSVRTTPEKISRTVLIAAYYYYYIVNFVDNHDGRETSFPELFKRFQKDIADRLESAYYMPLDSRNIFDVLIVFSAYAYLNL